jgi:hypothetical protein
MNEPKHLENAEVTRNDIFKDNEILYRRYINNKKYPENQYFTEIPTKDFIEGISVNRALYCVAPEDVLWSDSLDESGKCVFTHRGGSVIKTTVGDLKSDENETGISLYCEHSLKQCNISHCDIKFAPPLTGNTPTAKQKAIDVKLFLASLFEPV